MGKFAIGTVTKIASWAIALVIVALNAKLVYDEIATWIQTIPNPIYIWVFVVPFAIGAVGLLFYIMFKPLLDKRSRKAKLVPHIEEVIFSREPEMMSYRNIAIALDFSEVDSKAISSALQLGRKDASYTLIHIVETVGAMVYGNRIDDYETISDKSYLETYRQKLITMGYTVEVKLGFGSPKRKIPKIVNEGSFDMLIL